MIFHAKGMQVQPQLPSKSLHTNTHIPTYTMIIYLCTSPLKKKSLFIICTNPLKKEINQNSENQHRIEKKTKTQTRCWFVVSLQAGEKKKLLAHFKYDMIFHMLIGTDPFYKGISSYVWMQLTGTEIKEKNACPVFNQN